MTLSYAYDYTERGQVQIPDDTVEVSWRQLQPQETPFVLYPYELAEKASTLATGRLFFQFRSISSVYANLSGKARKHIATGRGRAINEIVLEADRYYDTVNMHEVSQWIYRLNIEANQA